MSSSYPLPREIRESPVYVGDGGASYGPFSFEIFDVEDVEVRVSRGGALYATEDVVVRKATTSVFSSFSIELLSPIGGADRFQVFGRRLHERSTDVTRGGTVGAAALERELSAQGVVLQELRRDADRNLLLYDQDAAARAAVVALATTAAGAAQFSAASALASKGQALVARDETLQSEARAQALVDAASAGFTGFPNGTVFDEGYEGPYDGPTYFNLDEGFE